MISVSVSREEEHRDWGAVIGGGRIPCSTPNRRLSPHPSPSISSNHRTSHSVPDKSRPLGCLHCNLHTLGLKGEIRPQRLIFYCNMAWPQHKLENHSQWPENGTFNYNTLRDLDNFCQHTESGQKLPVSKAFFTLRARTPTAKPTLSKFSQPTLSLLLLQINLPPSVHVPVSCQI